jgi:hypothetical protein
MLVIPEWEVQVIQRPGTWLLDIYIFRQAQNNKTEILKPDGSVRELEEGVVALNGMDASISFHKDIFQKIINGLSDKGYKAQEGFLEGSLAATKLHLEDMRKLVFENCKPEIYGVERTDI